MSQPSPFMTYEETCDFLRIDADDLKRMIYRRKINFRKHGSKYAFLKTDVIEYSESREQTARGASHSKFRSVRNRLRSLTTENTQSRTLSSPGKEMRGWQ